MTPKAIILAGMFACLCVFKASAYEVWMGTHLATHAMATNLSAWSTVAPQLDGYNVNRAPHDTDPASNDDWRTIFAQFTKANTTGRVMSEVARSEITKNPAKTNELATADIHARLSTIFGFESTYNYDLDILMFYDEAGTYQGTNYLYEWTDIEVQIMRDWMNTNGYADVKLMWNVRNNSQRNQYYGAHPLVDLIQIEASTTAFLGNINNQITYLQWFWTNPATTNKDVMLQIPRALPEDPYNQYEGTRRLAVMLGGILGYGDNGVRSSRLIFEPVTYNDNYQYIPETTSGGTAYHNRLTSICLSLIEQRSLFEGRVRLPTNADADSTTRLFAPTVTRIADQILSANTPTGPLAFTIGDDVTAPAALTLIKETSNTNLVPLANIVFGGSGSNRTVNVTPATGQSGSSLIKVWVSDGTLATPVTFTVTVLPPGIIPGALYSTNADCSITEAPAIEKLTDATVDLGARGSSPWVERCTVYVFQLPDLGAVTNPFTAATFTFNYITNGGSALRGHDLYGLGRRASSTVLTGDFYSQTATADPTDATRLQQSILTDSTPLGLVSTSGGGNANLLAYLNAQYAGGAGVGQYVFLRLNTRSAKTGISYATLTMSEGGVAGQPDTRPRITYQAAGNTAPTISAIADQTILANTNTGPLAFTIGDDLTAPASLTLNKLSSNTSLVPLANIVFGGSDANRTVTVTPTAGQSGSALISIIVNDGSLSTTNSFNLTVWPPGTVIGTVTKNTTGTLAWVCPTGVTNVMVECWGGGGAGGGAKLTATSGGAGGGGGAAGAYARRLNVPVTPGSSYNLTIPAGATCAGGFSDGQRFNGSAVTFIGNSGVTVTAAGGEGGASHIGNANAPSGVGSTTGCVGEQFYRGGSGGNYGSNNGGNGGGGPSDLAAGGDGSTTNNSGGIGATGSDPNHNGGSGGNGKSGQSNGNPGITPGGGGGGAKSQTQNVEYIGGAGGLGQIILTYVQFPAVQPPTLGHSLSGGNLVLSWTGSGFKLQVRTNLTSGTWTDVPGATNSPVNITPSQPAAFYRLMQQ